MARMKVVVCVTGASGAPYAYRFMEILRQAKCETTLVVSKSAGYILDEELSGGGKSLLKLATEVLDNSDLSGWPASGSRKFDAVVIVPCSASTMAKISVGIADNLITRAASVALKERRRLIIVPRETPLSLPMIEAMRSITLAGGVILPAMPAFYHKPNDISDLVNFVASRIASSIGIEAKGAPKWSPK